MEAYQLILEQGSHYCPFQKHANSAQVIGYYEVRFSLLSVNHNYGASIKTSKNRNKQNGSKSTNHNWQTWPFDPVKMNRRFLRGLLRRLTAAKNKLCSNSWLEQSFCVSENHNNSEETRHSWTMVESWLFFQTSKRNIKCDSRKYSYPPHGRSLEIPRGRGISTAKIYRGKYGA